LIGVVIRAKKTEKSRKMRLKCVREWVRPLSRMLEFSESHEESHRPPPRRLSSFSLCGDSVVRLRQGDYVAVLAHLTFQKAEAPPPPRLAASSTCSAAGGPPPAMAPSTSSSSGRSPTTSQRSSSTLRTTSSGSMSRTRTPERYGGAAPRGLLPGLVPMVDGQEGGGSGGRRPSEVR
jgi:hypothetical protein